MSINEEVHVLIARLTTEKERAYDCHKEIGCGACITCLNKEITCLNKEVTELKWQVANWERKEVKRASCCADNEEKVKILERERMPLPKEIEEHAAHGRKFFGGAACLCPLCSSYRTNFTEVELRLALIDMTDPRHHDECKHPEHCVCVDLDSRVATIRARKTLGVRLTCPVCSGTKKILEDCDGSAGYRACPECA